MPVHKPNKQSAPAQKKSNGATGGGSKNKSVYMSEKDWREFDRKRGPINRGVYLAQYMHMLPDVEMSIRNPDAKKPAKIRTKTTPKAP